MQRPLSDALLSVHENVLNANSEVVDMERPERPQETIAFDIFGQPVTTVWTPVRLSSADFGRMKFAVEAYFAPPTMIDSADSFYGNTWYPSTTAFEVMNQVIGRQVKNTVISQFTEPEDRRDRNLDLIIDGRHINDGLKHQSSSSQLNIFDTEVSGRAFGTELGVEVSFPLETDGASAAQTPYDNDAFSHYRCSILVDGDVVYTKVTESNGEPNDHAMLHRLFGKIKKGVLMEHLDDLMVYA